MEDGKAQSHVGDNFMNSFVFHSELWGEMNIQRIRYLIQWNFITNTKGKVKINSLPLGYHCSQVRQQN